jgi:pimeloyl-ACP methyl ester carboxylesterase
MLIALFKVLLVAYALLLLAVALFQRRLLYFPTKFPSVAAALQSAARSGFAPWPDRSSGQIIGWKLAASGRPTASVLIAHGNAGCAIDRDYLATPIHQADAALDVYVLEYPGYGARDGSPSQSSIYSAVENALANLPDNLPVYLVSESIGTGVASHLAAISPARISGLALFAPYQNLADVAQNHMPILPAALLLRDRFNPGEDFKNYRGPIQSILAGADEVIPNKFGKRLYDNYGGPKNLEIIPGAHHNEIAEQSAEWWRGVIRFWRQNPLPTAPAR